LGHQGIVDQHRDDPDIARQRRLYFQPDGIVWVLQPPLPVSIGDGQPLRPDQCKQHFTAGDCLLDRLGEVDAYLDRVDVHEHLLGTKMPA
jgi:hypothetical protein